MNIEEGIVVRNEVSVNRDSNIPVRLLQCEMSGPDDVQSVELFRGSGVDACPVSNKSNVVVVSIGSWKIAIAVDDNVVPSVSEGEIMIYSIDPLTGMKKSTILLKTDGTLEINGNTDYAVAFNDLKAGFDQLKSDFNTFIASKYNLHNHPTAPTGPVSVPSVLGTSTTASIDAAKIATVRVP